MLVSVIKPFIKPLSFFVFGCFLLLFLIFKHQTIPNKWLCLFQIFKSNKTSAFLLSYIAGTEHILISVSDLTCAPSNERLLQEHFLSGLLCLWH